MIVGMVCLKSITHFISYWNPFSRGVHSGHRVDYGLCVSDWFKVGFCLHIGFYIIVNLFLSRVKSGSVTKSGE